MRRAVTKSRAKLAKILASFFRAQAPKLARQVAAARSKVRKADLSQDELDALDKVMSEIDFAGWSILVTDVQPVLDEIAKDGAYAALLSVHVDAGAGTLDVVNADALDYATERAAELVGMRYDELGRLVENPEAKWQITESTRDGLKQYVADAIKEGWSNDELAEKIQSSYAMSSERAYVIARTETNKASNEGTLIGYKASGVVAGKQWLTADDDLVSEECQANGEAGPDQDGVLMDLDEEYPSGDIAPPVHPNCRCTLAPYITAEAGTESEATA